MLRSNVRVIYLVIFLVLGLGALSLQHMPKAEDPQFEMPFSIVQIFAPGLSPKEIESQIVNPVEDSFRLLEKVKTIESIIKNGVVNFEVKFLYGTDPDDGFDDVVRSIQGIKANLPMQTSLRFVKAGPSTVNVMQIAISSNEVGYNKLKREAKRLQKRIEGISSVNLAEIWGAPEQVIQVAVDMNKLQKYKLDLATIQHVLNVRGNEQNAGYLDTEKQRYSIQLSGKFDKLTQIKETQIPTSLNRDIKVSDIAHVYYDTYKPNYLAYLNETPTLFVTFQQVKGTNIFEVKKLVEQEISNFQTSLSDNIQLTILFDQSNSVKVRVGGFLDNLWFGLGLILLSLFLFIGLKEAIAVSLTIPLSVSAALFFLDLMGMSFQQMTIAGLIISLGLLVDNALVVVEACVRKLEQQQPLAKNVAKAVKEVGWPITSGTLTTMLAFLPLLLLSSDTGDFMRALPAAVSLVLISSLLTALIIIPALLISWNIKPAKHFNLQSLMEKASYKIYRPILATSVRLPLVVLILGIVIAGFFISYFEKVGVSLFPKAEKNIIVVNLETPVNASIEHTRNKAFELAQELKLLPNVEYLIENVGGSNPRIYYNQTSRLGESHFAQLMLFLDSYDSKKIENIISQIRTRYENYPDGKVTVYEFQQGPVTDRPITVRIVGDNLEKLEQKANLLHQFLSNLEGISDAQNDSSKVSPEIKISFDEYALFNAGLSLDKAEQQISALINGLQVASFYDDYGESYPVIVQPNSSTLKELMTQTQLINSEGQAIALSQVAELIIEAGSAPFYHYQKQRMMKVSADYLPTYNVQMLTGKLVDYLETLDWQDGTFYILGGEEAARKESFGGLSQIMLIAFGGIFTILVIQFKSFIQPVIIFSIMPISVTGAIFGLYLTGNSFSMLAFIGMISLLGIVVNDSIIMVDSFNRHLALGDEKRLAMVKAATSRFTPIIFTSLTTILGLLPLTLYGGPLWEPMGWVIITGLVFSTFTCLFFVPSVALLLSFRK